MSEFKREPRDGGHTYVTHPDHPGFMFMLCPGEDDTEMTKAFDIFVVVEQVLATIRPEFDLLRAENERLRRLPTEKEIREVISVTPCLLAGNAILTLIKEKQYAAD